MTSIDKRPLLIGITGSIGTGKTTFCNLVKSHYPVYSADAIVYEIERRPEINARLSEMFALEIKPDGYISHRELGDIVFQDKEKLRQLNEFIHPLTLAEMQRIVNTAEGSVLCFEVPLLFEAQLERCFDFIVTIIASESCIYERLKTKDRFSGAAIRHRLSAQLPQIDKAEKSDLVIDNSLSLAVLQAQVRLFLDKISTLPFKPLRQPFYPLYFMYDYRFYQGRSR